MKHNVCMLGFLLVLLLILSAYASQSVLADESTEQTENTETVTNSEEAETSETVGDPLPLSADKITIEQVFTLEGTFYNLLTENDHSFSLYTFDPESGTGTKLCEIRSFGAPILDDGVLYYTDYDNRLTVMEYDVLQSEFREVMTATEGTRVSVDCANGGCLAISRLTCDENEVVDWANSDCVLYNTSSGQTTVLQLPMGDDALWAFLGGNNDYFIYYAVTEAYSLYALELKTGKSVELKFDPAWQGSVNHFLVTEDACYFIEDYTFCRTELSEDGEILKAELPRTAGDVLALQEYNDSLYVLTRFAGEIIVYEVSASLEFVNTFEFELEDPQNVRDFSICEQGILFNEWYDYEWVPDFPENLLPAAIGA